MARRGTPAQLNALIAVDKPCGITSHDVVSRVRRAVDERRVGHAGTLDPMASGVMVVGIGQATRLLGLLTLDTKSYVASIRFGAETNTDDSEGEVARTVEMDGSARSRLLDEAFARSVLERFKGTGEQVPPTFSAISVAGVRSYKRARAGEEVELPARPIRVYAADLLAVSEAPAGDGKGAGTAADDIAASAAPGTAPASPAIEWTVSFTVSKGTYIRALARDIGRAAGSAAHVSLLRRTASGSVSLASCVPLEGLDADAARRAAIDPIRALGMPALEVGERDLADILQGRAIRVDRLPAVPDGPGSSPAAATAFPLAPAAGPSPATGPAPIALTHRGTLAAIARAAASGSLAMEHVFPQPIEGVRA